MIEKPRPQVRYEVQAFPSQEKFYRTRSKFCGFSGSVGCIAGETVIEGTGMPVAELCARGIAPVVQTLLGPIQAGIPFLKGRADMFEVTTTAGHRIVVTGQHLFFSSRGWLRADELQPHERLLVYSAYPAGSTSEPALSGSQQGGPHLWRTPRGSLDRYSRGSRPGGAPPRQAEDSARVSSPLPSEIQESCRCAAHTDGPLAQEPSHIRPCPRCGHPSRPCSYPLAGLESSPLRRSQPEAQFRGGPHILEPEVWSSLFEALSRSDARLQTTTEQLRRDFAGMLPSEPRIPSSCLAAPLPNYQVRWDAAASIKFLRRDVFFDLHVPGAEHYFAGGLINHNSGKTYALVYKALMLSSENPGCTGLLGAPTIPMLRSVTIAAMLEVLEDHGIPFTFRSQSASLYLPRTKSKIVFRPLEYFDRLRGYNLAWFGVDELTYCKEGAWQVLQQRIRDPKAKRLCGFAVWTPKGFDWVYDRFISPATKLEGYEAVIAGPRENVAILQANPNYYEELKLSYDTKFYQQEAEGKYLNIFSGRVYYAYESAQNDAPLAFNPNRRLSWALDFNIDPMSSVLVQDMGGRLHVLDEISLRGASINDMCERFIEKVAPLQEVWRRANGEFRPLEVVVYGDAAANQGNHQTKKSDYQTIKEYFRSVPDIKLIWNENTSNPPIKDRVASVNRLLCDAQGRVRVLIDPKCRELLQDLLKVSWRRGAEGLDLDKKTDVKRTHMTDALGYLIYRDYKLDSFERVITRQSDR